MKKLVSVLFIIAVFTLCMAGTAFADTANLSVQSAQLYPNPIVQPPMPVLPNCMQDYMQDIYEHIPHPVYLPPHNCPPGMMCIQA